MEARLLRRAHLPIWPPSADSLQEFGALLTDIEPTTLHRAENIESAPVDRTGDVRTFSKFALRRTFPKVSQNGLALSWRKLIPSREYETDDLYT
jgi:hypothetical protein